MDRAEPCRGLVAPFQPTLVLEDGGEAGGAPSADGLFAWTEIGVRQLGSAPEADAPNRPDPGESFRAATDEVLAMALHFSPLLSLQLEDCDLNTSGASCEAAVGHAVSSVHVFSTPLPHSDWLSSGTLNASARPEDAEAAERAVQHAAAVVAHLISSERRREQAEALARRALTLAGTDALTQLGNLRAWRSALKDEQERVRRFGGSASVIVLDLDGLKKVNDSSGHRAGDLLLMRFSRLLLSLCRGIDTVCRIGGDEFGILAPQADTTGAEVLVHRVRQACERAQIAVSIGAATVQPQMCIEDAWEEADATMYAEKQASAQQRA